MEAKLKEESDPHPFVAVGVRCHRVRDVYEE